MRLHSQPHDSEFGSVLLTHLEDGGWQGFTVVSAWATRAGTRRLLPALQQFLNCGGTFKAVIGIDRLGTSAEALEDLISLEAVSGGTAETFVYHHEGHQDTFHPKVYMFESPSRARLIIGSSNLTGGGLRANLELSLDVDGPKQSAVFRSARETVDRLSSLTNPCVRRLDSALLGSLLERGYVLRERQLRTRRAAAGAVNRIARTGAPLFGPVATPKAGDSTAAEIPIVQEAVLLLRPRRASESARRTQIQLPIRLIRGNFFKGVSKIRSISSDAIHPLVKAHSRKQLNTVKLEVPEIADMGEPLLRITRSGATLSYEALDAGSTEGQLVFEALEEGFQLDPPATEMTLPRDKPRSTWFRFV